MDGFDDILQEFLLETQENLQEVEQSLLALESSPTDPDCVSSIFRAVHTLKGTCGFLGFANLEQLAHAGEDLLADLRDGSRPFSTAVANAIFQVVDTVKTALKHIELHGNDADWSAEPLVQELRLLRSQSACEDDTRDSICAADASGVDVREAGGASSSAALHNANSSAGIESLDVQASTETLRVRIGVLDELLDLVGELVLARNRICGELEQTTGSAPLASLQRLNYITARLRDSVMHARMQPISRAWDAAPRIVRDLAAEQGKEIQVKLVGGETEVDKVLLEALKDPLLHLIRNAVDHGLECPSERDAAGKPPEGTLELRAYHSGGQVVVEIQDDGRGIDRERVLDRARALGISVDRFMDAEDEDAIFELLFTPGFSTNDEVTRSSGRGVGLDVVRCNLQQLRGTISVHSTPGEGTVFRMHMPLTLAILPALIIRCGASTLAIPQSDLIEAVFLSENDTRTHFDELLGARFYRHRGELLPVLDLAFELGLVPEPVAEGTAVVVQVGHRRCALRVDAVCDLCEVVIKPLATCLRQIGVYSGATVLGNGTLALVLDTAGLLRRRNVGRSGRVETCRPCNEDPRRRSESRDLLLLEGKHGRYGIWLAEVARVSQVRLSDLTRRHGQLLARWEDRIVTVIDFAGFGMEAHDAAVGNLVHWTGDDSVACLFSNVIDIIEFSPSRIQDELPDQLPAALIDGEIVSCLDLGDVQRFLHDGQRKPAEACR